MKNDDDSSLRRKLIYFSFFVLALFAISLYSSLLVKRIHHSLPHARIIVVKPQKQTKQFGIVQTIPIAHITSSVTLQRVPPASIIEIKQVVVMQTVPTNTRDIAHTIVDATWGDGEWESFVNVEDSEAGFNLYAINPSSGACGLMQALPCSKLHCNLSDAQCQITSMVEYIKERYGTPSATWRFHISHGWY